MERGMQFIAALFGGTDNTALNAAFALGLVLVLVVLGLWVLKFATSASANLGRPGKRRLSVIDSTVVDSKRKIVIIRRDNVEHVIMTGGPADLVIETGLPVAEPPPRRAGPQKPPRRPAAAPPPDIATPPAHDHNVTREAIDRLRDLARPAPLKPVDPARFHGLMRPDIPTGPQLRVDNSAGATGDSVRTGAVDGTDGPPRIAGRNRFFRSVRRREQG
jgi:flagellar protein FliO/FliZ